jgi:hypothetical protein
VRERSNVVTFPLPGNDVGSFTFPIAAPPAPVPPAPPVVVAPPPVVAPAPAPPPSPPVTVPATDTTLLAQLQQLIALEQQQLAVAQQQAADVKASRNAIETVGAGFGYLGKNWDKWVPAVVTLITTYFAMRQPAQPATAAK